MQDLQIVSGRQIEFVFQLRNFKQRHNMSWGQIARIASIYAEPLSCTVTGTDLFQFALFRKIPSQPKMQAILNMLNLSVEDLLYYAGN